MYQKHTQMIIVSLIGFVIVGVIGCQMLERQPTAPVGGGDVTAQTNYIVGGAEDSGWTAYYQPGDKYFKLTIPIVGVIKIQYTVIQGVQTGATFTIVLKTTKPTTHEIGLQTFIVDGEPVTDVVDCVTVIYVENGDFAAMPANAVFTKTGRNYIQYKRATGESETEEWWTVAEAAQFVMSGGEEQTMNPYCQQQLLVDEGQPASRPAPAPAPVVPVWPPTAIRCETAAGSGVFLPDSVTYSGRTWYSGPQDTSCNTVCAANGLPFNAVGQALSDNDGYCTGLGAAFAPAAPYQNMGACGGNGAGCHYNDTDHESQLCTSGLDPDWTSLTDCQFCACN